MGLLRPPARPGEAARRVTDTHLQLILAVAAAVIGALATARRSTSVRVGWLAGLGVAFLVVVVGWWAFLLLGLTFAAHLAVGSPRRQAGAVVITPAGRRPHGLQGAGARGRWPAGGPALRPGRAVLPGLPAHRLHRRRAPGSDRAGGRADDPVRLRPPAPDTDVGPGPALPRLRPLDPQALRRAHRPPSPRRVRPHRHGAA